MSTKQKRPSKSLIIITVVLALLALAVIANGAATTYLLRQNELHDTQRLAALIVDGAEGMTRPIPIDVAGKHYIPMAKLTLPAPGHELGEVHYGYYPNEDAVGDEVRLVSKNAVRAARSTLQSINSNVESVFDAVPKLQSCARGIHITFKPVHGQKAEATKVLANGKTAHFYVEDLCRNTELLEFARQIESY